MSISSPVIRIDARPIDRRDPRPIRSWLINALVVLAIVVPCVLALRVHA